MGSKNVSCCGNLVGALVGKEGAGGSDDAGKGLCLAKSIHLAPEDS